MAKKKVKPEEEPVVIPPEDIESPYGCAEGETQPRCGFSHIQSIVIQEVVKKKALKSTAPFGENQNLHLPHQGGSSPLRHANKYLLGNQRVIVPGMDTDENLQYKYSYVGDGIQIHVFWSTKKPKLCDKN